MSRDRSSDRKAPLVQAFTRPARSAESTRPGGVYATVARDSDAMRASLTDGDLPQAQATVAIDCGQALIYDGYPELRLGQRQRIKSSTLTRLLVVRYSMDIFKMRARDNEPFRDALEQWLQGLGPSERGEAGYFSAAIEKAGDSEPATVTVDADSEWMLRTGHKAAITFISTTAWDLYKASTGKSDGLYLYGPVEVTMPVRVMADVLLSWKKVADGMDDTTSDKAQK